MVISVEFGMRKFILILFSLLILALALYPSIIYDYIQLFDPEITYFVIAATALVQLVFIIRMKRPRVF